MAVTVIIVISIIFLLVLLGLEASFTSFCHWSSPCSIARRLTDYVPVPFFESLVSFLLGLSLKILRFKRWHFRLIKLRHEWTFLDTTRVIGASRTDRWFIHLNHIHKVLLLFYHHFIVLQWVRILRWSQDCFSPFYKLIITFVAGIYSYFLILIIAASKSEWRSWIKPWNVDIFCFWLGVQWIRATTSTGLKPMDNSLR